MFKTVNYPLFNVDGGTSGGGDSKDWGNFLNSLPDPVQPEGDTVPEALEDEEEEVAHVEEAEPDDEPLDVEESEEEAEPDEVQEVEDPDIEMGDGKKAVKLSELKSGFMRQSDYTKKTQELATQRKEVESLRESLKGVESWANHMNSNPWLWEQVNGAIQTFNSTGVLPLDEVLQDAQYGQYINHLMAENNQLKKDLEGIKGEYEGVKLTSEMTRLKGELTTDYGDLVTDAYIESLQERAKTEKLSATTLKEIAEGHLAKQKLQTNQKDVKKISKESEAKAIQKLQETRKTAPKAPTTVAATPSREQGTNSKESWGDFLRRTSN